MVRDPGLSVRLKLTLSYAGFLMLAGFLMPQPRGSQAGRGNRQTSCCDTYPTL